MPTLTKAASIALLEMYRRVTLPQVSAHVLLYLRCRYMVRCGRRLRLWRQTEIKSAGVSSRKHQPVLYWRDLRQMPQTMFSSTTALTFPNPNLPRLSAMSRGGLDKGSVKDRQVRRSLVSFRLANSLLMHCSRVEPSATPSNVLGSSDDDEVVVVQSDQSSNSTASE